MPTRRAQIRTRQSNGRLGNIRINDGDVLSRNFNQGEVVRSTKGDFQRSNQILREQQQGRETEIANKSKRGARGRFLSKTQQTKKAYRMKEYDIKRAFGVNAG